MKTLKNIFYLQVVLFGLLLSGCYNDFSDPQPYKVYTDADFPGNTLITVAQLKKLYTDTYGNTINQAYDIHQDYVLKGKLISNDAYGNIYRTMYLQDATGGMEIKIGTSGIYNELKVGQTVYVKLKGLVIGNYRYMYSVGAPTETGSKYPTGYIEVKEWIARTIFPGERTQLTKEDTLVVTSSSQLTEDMLGRLIRFENLVSYYGTWDQTQYPTFLEVVAQEDGSDRYTDCPFVQVIAAWKAYDEALAQHEQDPDQYPVPTPPSYPRVAKDYPTFAYNYDNNHYYGSALFRFRGESGSDRKQNLLVYTSGYARFALSKLPENGDIVTATAIYSRYGSQERFLDYQLLLNNVTDLVIVGKQ